MAIPPHDGKLDGEHRLGMTHLLRSYAVWVVLGAYALRLLANRFKCGLRNIPGPTVAKYTRLWKLHSAWKGDHHTTAIKLHRKHGPLVRIGPNHISIDDPTAIPVIYGLNKRFTKVGAASPTFKL